MDKLALSVTKKKEIMKIVQKEIEDWIKPFATIVGDSIEVDEKLKEENPFRYFLRLTIPNIFESYAVVLHSFWRNKKISKEEIRESNNNDRELPEEDFDRIKWKEFFANKGKEFKFENAYKSTIDFYKQFNQMDNELFPGEGAMDEEHLNSLIEIIQKIYGNQEIEVFYILLSTKDWEKDRIYKGKISDLNQLFNNEELILTPSLIYPKDKNWVVNTDYDLPFSFIGGEKKLIDELVSRNEDEIYELKY